MKSLWYFSHNGYSVLSHAFYTECDDANKCKSLYDWMWLITDKVFSIALLVINLEAGILGQFRVLSMFVVNSSKLGKCWKKS